MFKVIKSKAVNVANVVKSNVVNAGKWLASPLVIKEREIKPSMTEKEVKETEIFNIEAKEINEKKLPKGLVIATGVIYSPLVLASFAFGVLVALYNIALILAALALIAVGFVVAIVTGITAISVYGLYEEIKMKFKKPSRKPKLQLLKAA